MGERDNTPAAIHSIQDKKLDIVLMDLQLPGMSGLEAILEIHAKFPGVNGIVLTTYEGDEDIHQALQAGASAYIAKGMKHDRRFHGIRRVNGGKTCLLRRCPKSLMDGRSTSRAPANAKFCC